MKHTVALGIILLLSGLASGYASQDTQIPNNPITITGCTNPTITETNLLTIDFGHTDLDTDIGNYSTNATEGSLDSATGIYTWTPTSSDSGIYVWNFNTTDGYGSIDDCNVTITVEDYEVIPDITSPFPATPITTQNYAADISMGATIDSSTNNHWEIDSGSGYTDIGWNNSTTSPTWAFSPSYDIGDHNIRLTTHNLTGIEFNQSYVWAIHVEGNWTTHNIILEPYFTVTIIAKDSTSYATISSFTATFNEIEKSTTTGSISFNTTAYGLYSLQVTASGHYSSTTSVLVTKDDTTTIYLPSTTTATTAPGEGTYYAPHYVRFVVTNIWGTRYEGVSASATWIDAEGTPLQKDATTGSDGAVGFNMTQNIMYTVTFIDASQGINETLTVYPTETEYLIYIDSFSWTPPENQTIHDTVDWYWTSERINTTHGWINFTYTDTNDETTYIEYWINSSNDTNLYTFNTTYPTDWTVSQIVEADNKSYLCHVSADHPRFGSLLHSIRHAPAFRGIIAPFGWDEQWMYDTVAICAIIFIGLLFSATSVNVGAVMCAMSGWLFVWMGWLSGTTINYGMMVLATILAVGFALRKGETMKA